MKATHIAGLIGALVLAATAAASGCSDDETTTTTVGPGPTSSSKASSGSGTPSSASASTTGGGGNGGTGGENAGGMNQGGAAASFCQDYNTPCTFGMDGHFASQGECETAWNDATAECQGCWVTHLANAGADTGSIHCTHACGSGQGVPAACSACGNSCQ